MGTAGIVIVFFFSVFCIVTFIIGISLAVAGLIFFIMAFTSSGKKSMPIGYGMPPARACLYCGRPMDYYAHACPWCGYGQSYQGYPATGPAPVPPQQPPQQPPPCPSCKAGLRFVHQYGRWYCDACNKYQ